MYAQSMQPTEYEKLKDKIKGIKIAMLTTIDSQGDLRSRPMATQEMDENGTLWFFTSDDSHKVEELQRNNKVQISYSDEDAVTYVSVSGIAELTKDSQKINELWSDAFRAWFPGGKDDPRLALLKITPYKAEYWDSPGGKMQTLFEMIKGVFTGESDKSSQHEKLGRDS
ncbi:pyridoxamine 5'-phosphate oxidase family protein [Cytophagaceae bacterium DM2B3-1]|uniref:Pyridoxamine 5'-phosphate oxidase family protein n=1 Tax=Xanthocytophaga flava TaxID=3048013 RepID=A0AAE3U6C4_9BACT|nr:pyridoxamine 5'-phosphate oxidase family protein [Xanthocytophaga flavus]MDJ1481216.1 pyridoxamine 5'-phosphate oxidase family protein [Xanthocytophaga flavus]MDJ1495928.1 pyridoxamine 5'-phosphate oxidase family protein [Xanthocytophaga flavus]